MTRNNTLERTDRQMALGSIPTWLKLAGAAAVFLSAYGVVVGVFHDGFRYIWKLGIAGGWSWWQYALAVPLLGLIALGLEAIGEFLFISLKGWSGRSQPMWRRAIAFVVVVTVGMALLIGPWLLVTAGQ